MTARPLVLLGLAVALVSGVVGAAQEGPVDCGRTGATSPGNVCMEERFRACQPATLVGEFPVDAPTLATHWEVLEPREARCAVRMTYLLYPDPDYLGKEMLCYFDPALPFHEAVQDWSTCNGTLLGFMAGVGDAAREFVIGRGGLQDVARTSPVGTSRTPFRAEFFRREGQSYFVAVEHTGDPSCGRQELVLPAYIAFRCGSRDWLFVLNPTQSTDEQLVFALFQMGRGN